MREALTDACAFLFDRGLAFGTSGNVSVRNGDSIVITPTGASLGAVMPTDLAEVDLHGNARGDQVPSKELPFHLAVYRTRVDAHAVVHLHSHYATAVSCLHTLDLSDALPALTPYYVMNVPSLPVVPYYPPGDARLGEEVAARAGITEAMLMRNHGSITFAATLSRAVSLAEELEATARLYLELGTRAAPLSAEQIAVLHARRKR